MRQLNACPEI